MAYQPKSYKKFVATAATATLVASAIVPVASASGFSDVQADNEFATYINALAEAGIIGGYASDNTFRPNNKLTRGQVAIMLGRWLENNGATIPADWDTNPRFEDVSTSNEELAKYAALVKDAGVFTGVAGKLNAADNITRENMAVVLDRVSKTVTGTSLVELAADIEDVTVADLGTTQYKEQVQALADLGITTVSNFRPKETVSRAQFAKFLYTSLEVIEAQAVTAEKLQAEIDAVAKTLPAVDSITADNAAAAKATVETAKAELAKIKTAIAEAELTEEEVAGLEKAIAAVETTMQAVVAKADKAIEDAKELAVESVKMINATELLVTFNKTVNKDSANTEANYKIETKAPFTVTTVDVADVQLQEDGKSAIVRVNNTTLTPAVVYNVTVDGVVDTKYAKIKKYEGTVTATEAAAPTLAGVAYVGGTVELTFKEEVDFANAIVKVDGVQVTTADFAAKSSNAGEYTYVATLANAANKTEGAHSVSVVGLKNKAGKEATTLTGSYTVSNDTVAPTVTKVTASETSAYEFTVEFSEVVTAPTVKVTKGSTTYTATATADTATAKKWVVAINDISGANALYPTNVNEVAVNYEISGFKDAANLIGTAVTGSVTLSKDFVAPAVKSANLNTITTTSGDTVIVVPFTEAITAVGSTVTVKDPEGILQTANVSVVNGSELKLTIASHATKEGKYEIVLPSGLVTDGGSNKNVATTTSVTYTATTTNVVELANTAITPSNSVVNGVNTNVITVNFGQEMTETALQLANYTLDNVALPAGTTIGFVGNKNTVQITLPASYVVSTDAAYKFAVSKDLTTKAGQAIRLDDNAATVSTLQLEKNITLQDNKAPELKNEAKLLLNGATATTEANQVKLTFSETLQAVGTTAPANIADDFIVKVNGTVVNHTVVGNASNSNEIVLSIGSFNTAQTVTVELASTGLNLVDVKGNVIVGGKSVTATK
ncbi:S-layer homology domain-containing protein [Lysinibacillus sp. KU-BSD001]|uniref:S-layer homology domain-containing protein n=1 Tax=Lysinibacillus sp. KU-BSD001 TaxID=3141328 RepID=UPI0036F1871E